MSQYKKDSTIANWAVCAIIFGTFTYLYTYHYQTSTLAYIQHVYSGGVTVYRPFISTVIILVIGFVLQFCMFAIARLRGASHALTYLPSMLFLALLTSAYDDGHGGIERGWWVWTTPVLLGLYYCGIRIVKQWINAPKAKKRFLASNELMVNLMTMIIMMLVVLSLGNGDELFHRQVRAERMLLQGRYSELAEEVEKPCNRTNKTLTLYRFIAMSHEGTLTDKAFSQPVEGGTASLTLLQGVHPLVCTKDSLKRFMPFVVKGNVKSVSRYIRAFQNGGKSAVSPKSFDYLLCSLLAERDIDSFARTLASHVNVNDSNACDTLPRHYKEALVLYQHMRSNPVTSYQDRVLEADYQDMRTILHDCLTPEQQRFEINRNYANSYWSYYENAEILAITKK